VNLHLKIPAFSHFSRKSFFSMTRDQEGYSPLDFKMHLLAPAKINPGQFLGKKSFNLSSQKKKGS